MSQDTLDQKLFSFNDFNEIYLKNKSLKPFQGLIDLKTSSIERSINKNAKIDKLEILIKIHHSLVSIDRSESINAYHQLIMQYPEYEGWYAQNVDEEIIKLVKQL